MVYSITIPRNSGITAKMDCLKLKIGPWIVLENELSLHLGRSGDTSGQSVVENNSTSETEVVEYSREPVAVNNPSMKTFGETPSKINLSEEEKKLSLLRNALHLDMESQTECEDQCLVRSIFVKRGKGANALEKLFTFVVILKEELAADNASKLWRKIRDKFHDWMKLLTKKNREDFRWNDGSESFLHIPSKEIVSLRDGKVVQVFLDNLPDIDFQQNVFVVLVDKQLFTSTQTAGYLFKADKKFKYSFSLKLNANESKYHASFDPKRPSQDLGYSKHFNSFLKGVDDLSLDFLTPAPFIPLRPFDLKLSRPFFYKECLETGPRNLIKPVHEFKFTQGEEQNDDETFLDPSLYEKLSSIVVPKKVESEVEAATAGVEVEPVLLTAVRDGKCLGDYNT